MADDEPTYLQTMVELEVPNADINFLKLSKDVKSFQDVYNNKEKFYDGSWNRRPAREAPVRIPPVAGISDVSNFKLSVLAFFLESKGDPANFVGRDFRNFYADYLRLTQTSRTVLDGGTNALRGTGFMTEFSENSDDDASE